MNMDSGTRSNIVNGPENQSIAPSQVGGATKENASTGAKTMAITARANANADSVPIAQLEARIPALRDSVKQASRVRNTRQHSPAVTPPRSSGSVNAGSMATTVVKHWTEAETIFPTTT